MKPELKDYLYLYLGATLIALDDDHNPFEVSKWHIDNRGRLVCEDFILDFSEVKILLRSLGTMTKEETREWRKAGEVDVVKGDSVIQQNANSTRYLLFKHFDLFGLIEAGLAIDKPKLTNVPTN